MKSKIINIILIVIAIVGSLYFVITRDREIGLILKDSAIIITITLPYLLEKIFKVKIKEEIKFIYILFVFMAHFLGATVELYNRLYYYDKVTHFVSGIISALAAFLILVKINKYDNRSVFFNILFIVSITMLIASCWEIFEYTANILFGGDAQKVALTGVNDTMQDMIVALLGSLLVSIIYWYEEVTKKSIIIKKFIDSVK